ncbi:hypothetical protein CYMTET_15211 [Cymbomonas tetramitiformis]|uniref:MAM domain-containing protein n=1 Tax=Cymbomonas tetramitiformis TaxID=36881 RepID=A0AAE0GFZ0_9CHLO|nr:hypothetical protein CYMTET_15211 [Cymbomonas tetramitiformis]
MVTANRGQERVSRDYHTATLHAEQDYSNAYASKKGFRVFTNDPETGYTETLTVTPDDGLYVRGERVVTESTLQTLLNRVQLLETERASQEERIQAVQASYDVLLQEKHPPDCGPPGGEKLQYIGGQWVCVCNTGYSGKSCFDTFTPTNSPATTHPTTQNPTSLAPTTQFPTTITPTTSSPTRTKSPSHTRSPNTVSPTDAPTTQSPLTASPSKSPTTPSPTISPTTGVPTPPVTQSPTNNNTMILSLTRPYSETFETGLGYLYNVGPSATWLVHSGATSTVDSGPKSSRGDGSTHYAYIDATHAYPNKIGVLQSPPIVPEVGVRPLITFYFHMYGRDSGSLYVDLYYAGFSNWTEVWSAVGSQGDEWHFVELGLPMASDADGPVVVREYASLLIEEDPKDTGVYKTGLRFGVLQTGSSASEDLFTPEWKGSGTKAVETMSRMPGLTNGSAGIIVTIPIDAGGKGGDGGRGDLPGASGTCFSGGAGAGGGGDGGRGYPRGGASGTGGMLVLIVGGNLTIGSQGSILSEGSAGGGVPQYKSAKGGGGSGGGIVILVHGGEMLNSGTISVSGGPGGAPGYYSWQRGSPGAAGLLQVVKADPALT